MGAKGLRQVLADVGYVQNALHLYQDLLHVIIHDL